MAALGTASCGGAVTRARDLVARAHQPALAVSVLAGSSGAVSAGVAAGLFASAPVVVVAGGSDRRGLVLGAGWAGRVHAPLLLTSFPAGGRAGAGAALRAQLRAVHAQVVLAAGRVGDALAGLLPGIRVVASPAGVPVVRMRARLKRVVVLVHRGDGSAAARAAVITARAAGARVITTQGFDPRADPSAVAALAAARPLAVVAIGAGFGPVAQLAGRLAVAVTGVQLPGGGQVLFPAHRLAALYGHPGAPSLGALGEQGLAASIARASRVARLYQGLSSVPVIPAFEIIATVAEAHPGPDGSYSYESPVSLLRPWVSRAAAAGMYVILDLQAGRASLLAQARRYEPLLKLADVGLALDPEWKLGPGQLPLRQIGSISAGQINSVSRWLASLTARCHLPQKVLVLHQFELSMITSEDRLDTHYDDLAIVIHMDGQGSPSGKQKTWRAVTAAAPAGVFFGWKNFYTKDHPMLSPQQTMSTTPQPVMISYQ